MTQDVTVCTRFGRIRLTGMLAAALCLCRVPSAPAEDRVTVQPPEARSPVTVVGEIEEFNARRIAIRTRSGVPLQVHSADEVLHVETHHVTEHRDGLSAYASGDVALAEELFHQALSREPRTWVKEEIRAWLVRCSLHRANRSEAAERFIEIIRREPETRHWDVAPLVWSPESISPDLREDAVSWLAERADAVRLLGASVFLLDSAYGEVAATEMGRLQRSPNRYVRDLADTQQWRLRLIDEELTPRQLAAWRDQIDRLPEMLRGGPRYLLGRAFAARREFDQAAAEFLWVPLVHDDDPLLAARATWDAANAISRLGRHEEAARLYNELAERYAWSEYAAEARARLEEMQRSSAGDAAP